MFRSLTIRNYRLLAAGQLISNTGTWMQRIAQDWLVLQLSGGSGIALGITTALQLLPTLILGPWSGALVDRVNKRKAVMASQILLALLSLSLGTLAVANAVKVSYIYTFALFLGLVTSIVAPAGYAFLAEIVDRQELPNAIAIRSIIFQFSRIGGPSLAGVLIACAGVGPAFLVNSASFLTNLIILFFIRPSELNSFPPATREQGRAMAGFRYVRERPGLILLLTLTAVVSIFSTNIPTQIALMTSRVFSTGPKGLGAATSALAAGAVVGALLAARRQRAQLRTILIGIISYGTLYAAAGLSLQFAFFLAALAMTGAAFATFNTAITTTLQLKVDTSMRGRVMSLYRIAYQGTAPIGAVLIGALADAFNPRVSMILGGLIPVITTLAITLVLGNLDEQE